jgi:molybdate transport system substrate-binding protein
MVEDRFGQLINISQTDIVILVPKDNPKNIKSLKDLAKPGMKIGVGDPQKTAMGKLTVDVLKDEGIYNEIKPNISNPFPEAPMVVGQVTQGALDAGLVYVANAHAQRDKVKMIKIDNPLSSATQTYAISKTSKHKHLMERLLNRLRSAAGQEKFVNAGFEVIASPGPGNE